MRSAIPEGCLRDLHQVTLRLDRGEPADMGAAFATIDHELGHVLSHYCCERGRVYYDARGRSYSLPALLESLSDQIPADLRRSAKLLHKRRNTYVHERGAASRPCAPEVRSYLEVVRNIVGLLYGDDGLRLIDSGLRVGEA